MVRRIQPVAEGDCRREIIHVLHCACSECLCALACVRTYVRVQRATAGTISLMYFSPSVALFGMAVVQAVYHNWSVPLSVRMTPDNTPASTHTKAHAHARLRAHSHTHAHDGDDHAGCRPQWVTHCLARSATAHPYCPAPSILSTQQYPRHLEYPAVPAASCAACFARWQVDVCRVLDRHGCVRVVRSDAAHCCHASGSRPASAGYSGVLRCSGVLSRA